MRKRFFNKTMSVALCLAMTFCMVVPAFATEDTDNAEVDDSSYEEDYSYDDNESSYEGDDIFEEVPAEGQDQDGASEDIYEITDYDSTGDGQADSFKEIVDEGQGQYEISVDTSRLSFGTHSVGSVIDGQSVNISNTGSKDVRLIWKVVDPDNAFRIDMTHAQSIAAGTQSDVHISVATNKGAGEYSAVIQFADETDPAYDDGVKVELSVTLTEDKPRIKRVILNPGNVSTAPGSYVQFTADTEGEGNYDGSVNFYVEGQKSSGTSIDSNGRLNVANDEKGGALTVKAVSKSDSSIMDSTRVEVVNNVYAVNVSCSPKKGGDVSGSGTYQKGSSVGLTAAPKNGWEFSGWKINGKNRGDSMFITIDNLSGNVEATAYFEKSQIRIKAEPNHDEMGSVEGDGYYDEGDTVVLKAIPESGYRFSCWMEGKKEVSKDTKLKIKDVDEDRSFKAIFTKNTFVVKANSCDTSMGKVDGNYDVEPGGTVTIKAMPNKGYKFVKWIRNDQTVSDKKEYEVKDIHEDMSFVAIFESEKSSKKMVSVNAGTTDSNGVISPSGKIFVEEGKSINFTVTPKSGYKIAAIALDGKQINVMSSFTISDIIGDHNVVVAFAPTENKIQTTETDKKKSEESAKKSAINNAAPVSTNKVYDENIMTMNKDTKGSSDAKGSSDTKGSSDSKDSRNSENNSDEDKDSMDNGLDSQEGVLQSMNMTNEEALEAIRSDGRLELMRTAVADETLEVNVSNTMRSVPMTVAYGDDAMEDPEVANFVEVLCELFTEEEMQKLVSGEDNVSVSITVAGMEDEYVVEGDKEAITTGIPSDKQVGKYFNASFIKTVDGVSSSVPELANPVVIRVDIPDNIYAEDREFAVARLHKSLDGNQEVSILDDIDDDAHTITFKTDRFSTYAIVYSSGEASVTNASNENITDSDSGNVDPAAEKPAKKNNTLLIVLVAILAVIGTVMAVLYIKGSRRSRKKRRR